jgi:putative two-component system response regulator
VPTKTILICDDERAMRELVRAVLDGGHRYEEAADGVGALETAREARPDAIVLDVMLPGGNGITILEQIRADPHLAEIPVVVLTAWPDMERPAYAAGASRFFMKPFEPEELRAAVEELLAP